MSSKNKRLRRLMTIPGSRKMIAHQPPRQQMRIVPSLLDAMQDGNEYGSIVGLAPPPDYNIIEEVVRGLLEIQRLRSCPCISYVGNVIRPDDGESGIDSTDDLPFGEMVNQIPQEIKKIDVFLATRGGSIHQVNRFVNCLRSRFEEVDFIIPSFCMSAGTLFALSGDRIWMTSRACLGPIDPQVPTKDGRYVPAQALLLLVRQLQIEGDQAIKNGRPVPWTAVRLIDSLDKKELGDALTATDYSTMMATEFLKSFKFKNWSIRENSGQPVTHEYRELRAKEIADALASHVRWKAHGHALSRDVLWTEIKLKIDHPSQELERAVTRLWALFNWLFDKTPSLKFIVSEKYRFVRYSLKREEKQ